MPFPILILLYSMILSCQTKSDAHVMPFDTIVSAEIILNSITIPSSDSLILSRGSKLISYSISGNNTYCYFEDCETRVIRVYNVPSFDLQFSLPVPQRLKMCEGFHNYQFQDSTFYLLLTDEGNIFAYKDSAIKQIADLKNIELNSKYEFTTWLLDHNQIFLKSDSSILVPITYNKVVTSTKANKRTYSSALLKEGSVYFLGDRTIPHWSEVYYGLIDQTYQYFTDSTIVYMFSQNAEIRVLNYNTGKLQTLEARSKFQINDITPVSPNDDKDGLWIHMKLSGHYERLVYDPWKKLYYRFFFLPIPAKLSDGTNSTVRDRQISVMILNENFKILTETLLPKRVTSIHIAFPTVEGLIINDGPVIAENGLNLIQIKYE